MCSGERGLSNTEGSIGEIQRVLLFIRKLPLLTHFLSSLHKSGFPTKANHPPRKAVRAGEPGPSLHISASWMSLGAAPGLLLLRSLMGLRLLGGAARAAERVSGPSGGDGIVAGAACAMKRCSLCRKKQGKCLTLSWYKRLL